MKVPDVRIEACVNSVESAVEAQKGGAYRVELCENLFDGGTTPSHGSIGAARENLDVKLNVMIRPRGGDFLYSALELKIMKTDVRAARDLGADGIVFGILHPDGTINMEQSREIMGCAGALSATFHRAFDMSADPFATLEDLVTLGVDRVLTSGQRPSALEGAELLTELVEKAAGRIIVMPGVGIDAGNISKLIERTNATEFHVLAERVVASGMQFRNDLVFMGSDPDQPEFERRVTDSDAIRAICTAAQKCA